MNFDQAWNNISETMDAGVGVLFIGLCVILGIFLAPVWLPIWLLGKIALFIWPDF